MGAILSEKVLLFMLATNFCDLPIQTQALLLLAVLVCVCLLVRLVVATADYCMEGRESREKRRERNREHRFDWLRILWGKGDER